MAESNRHSDVEMFFEDEFTFEDSLFAATDLTFDNESVQPTFISEEDVVELIGAQEFHCIICVKTFKSKTGLDIHVEKRHYTQPKKAFFNENDFINISREIKENLLKENLYSIEFIERLPNEVPERLQYFVNNLISNELLAGKHKDDHDSFYEKYSIAFTNASEYFPENKIEEANLFLLKLAKTVLFNVRRRTQDSVETSVEGPTDELKEDERGPLAYVAGSVLSQIYKKTAFGKRRGPWQEEIKSLFTETLRVESGQNPFIASMDRGGLWTPSSKLIGIIERAEKTFRRLAKPSLKSIPIDDIIKSCLSNPSIIAIWNSILMDHEGSIINEECAQACLSMIIKFFVRVRGFSHTKDIWKRHLDRQHLERKQKALRKTLKKKIEVKEDK